MAFLTSRRWWQWLLTGMVLAGLAVFLSTGSTPSPATDAVGAGIMVVAGMLLCAVRLVRRRRRYRAQDA